MAVKKQDDQHEHTFSNYVRIRDAVRNTCQRRWTIGKSGERGPEISILPARHDDDDDMFYNITGDISTLNGSSLKLVDKFTYLGSSVSSIKTDIDTRLTKAWTAINRLSVISNSDLTDKMKRSLFQAAIVSILLYGCTTWKLNKRLEKRIDSDYTRMLRALMNRSWSQQPTKQQLYGHLPPTMKTIQIKRTRHAGHCWRSRDKLISDVLPWAPSHDRAKAGRLART